MRRKERARLDELDERAAQVQSELDAAINGLARELDAARDERDDAVGSEPQRRR